MSFQIGNLVSLKSGGPTMTVQNVFTGESLFNKEPLVDCIWMASHGILHEHHFKEALLQTIS